MVTENKLKILFLDFDGVVSIPENGWHIGSEKVALVEQIIKNTNAKIVISSSWAATCRNANEFIDNIFGSWNEDRNGLRRDSLFIESIYDITNQTHDTRGEDIQEWLEKHDGDIESYCILDDDTDMDEDQLLNFVQTDMFEGITLREVKLCSKLLNNERIEFPTRMNTVLLFKWRDKYNGRESNIDDLLAKYYCRFEMKKEYDNEGKN